MPQRNSISISGKPAPVTTLRRSPRFIHPNQPNSVDPKNPNPESNLTRVSNSSPKSSFNKSRKLRRSEASEVKEKQIKPKSFRDLGTEKRRSARLNGGGEVSSSLRRSPRFPNAEALDNGKGCTKECERCRRQSSVCKIDNKERRSRVWRNAESQSGNGGCQEGVQGRGSADDLGTGSLSTVEELKLAVNSSKNCLDNGMKRVTRRASRASADKKNEVLMHGGNVNRDVVICLMVDPSRSMDKREGGSQVDKKHVGAKRKNVCAAVKHPTVQESTSVPGRKNITAGEEQPTVHRWTREQELALQRAYFTAKPTPHFWKKVAKMVPGKSAKDCFDKIHSDQLTPPQHQPRSKAKKTSSVSLSLSASKLLCSLEPKSKKLRYGKRKELITYKAMRELLYKQVKREQKNGADLFSVLEPSFDPSTQLVQDATIISSPECSKGESGLLKTGVEQSSSALGNDPSGHSDLHRASFISPPVLKQIKNKTLHDKYIDQLQFREAKRTAASLRTAKWLKGKNDAKENQVHKEQAIKRAKSCLILGARSAINQFLHQQSTMMDLDNADDDVADSAEDEMDGSL